MSAIEDALRTAEAEAEKERLEEQGYPGLSGMMNLPSGDRRGPSARILFVAGVALAVAVAGGWWAWSQLGGSGAPADGADGGTTPVAVAGDSAAGDGGRTAAGLAGPGAPEPASAETAASGDGEEGAGSDAGDEATLRNAGTSSAPTAERAAVAGTSTAVGAGDPGAEDERSTDAAPPPAQESAEPPSDRQARPEPEESSAESEAAASGDASSMGDEAAPPQAEQQEPAETSPAEEPSPTPEAAPDSAAAEAGDGSDAAPPVADGTESDPAGEVEPGPGQLRPELARRYFRQAISLSDAGDLEGAVERYRRAVAADSTYVEAWNNLGIVLHRLGQLEEAERALRSALEHRPDYHSARTNLGIVLLDLDRSREAVEAFREVLVDGEASFEAYANLGVAYRRLDRLGSARRALERALEVAPGEPMAHYQLARVLEADGQRMEAVRHYRAFLEAEGGTSDLRIRVRRHVDRLRRRPGGG